MLMFGLPVSMLNLSRDADGELIVFERFNWWVIDAIYNQYLIMLGEFTARTNMMSGSESGLVISVFCLATFCTQITMLNMLIAIMSDVFDELMEQRDVKAISTKLTILSEAAPVLSQKSAKDEEEVYMVVVEPTEEDAGESEAWQGTINQLTRITKKEMLQLQQRLNKKTDKLQNVLTKTLKKSSAEIESVKEEIESVREDLSAKIDTKVDELNIKLDTKVGNLRHDLNAKLDGVTNQVKQEMITVKDMLAKLLEQQASQGN